MAVVDNVGVVTEAVETSLEAAKAMEETCVPVPKIVKVGVIVTTFLAGVAAGIGGKILWDKKKAEPKAGKATEFRPDGSMEETEFYETQPEETQQHGD